MALTSSATHVLTTPNTKLGELRTVNKKIPLTAEFEAFKGVSDDLGSPRLHLKGHSVSAACQQNPGVPAVWIGKLAKLALDVKVILTPSFHISLANIQGGVRMTLTSTPRQNCWPSRTRPPTPTLSRWTWWHAGFDHRVSAAATTAK